MGVAEQRDAVRRQLQRGVDRARHAKRTLHVLDPDRLADIAGFEEDAFERL